VKATLDYTQRLNLHALMGQQRAALDDVRTFWRLQDYIGLNEEERKAINYRVEQVGDMQVPRWDIRAELSGREFEFTTDEAAKLYKILKEWQAGFVVNDRFWLESLIRQFESSNGQPPLVQ
jgi:hypothetical protein